MNYADSQSRPASAANPTNIDFQLHTLGWKSFQDLCLIILRDQLGQAVQEYSVVRDGGRDGAFVGEWEPRPGLALTGETIVQCKFTSRPSAGLTLSGLAPELRKVERLWSQRPRANYILLTNHVVTAQFEEEIRLRCRAFKCDNFFAFGREWINSAIARSPRLRMLVPRLYGLGDLSQILDERWYRQTERLLIEERENLRKFVPTLSYRTAVKAVDAHGFVLLLGAPAVGKTAIAATLALAAGDAWKCRPMKLDHPTDLRTHWNTADPRQLFWIDDAFGMLQYDASRAHDWNGALPWLQAMLNGGAKIVLTSRNYIYARARADLKHSAFPLLRESEVVVDVSKLSTAEREQILYNHVKLGGQTASWRKRFKSCFSAVAEHERFMPEIARRLGSPNYTTALKIPSQAIEYVERPEEFLKETIEGLGRDDHAALAAVFLRGGALHSPVSLLPGEIALITRLGSSPDAVPGSLTALRGSFVRFSPAREAWEFSHPTVGDAFASILAENPELLDLYVTGVPMNRMLREATCGVDDLPGSTLAVPSSRFEMVSDRLIEYANEGENDERSRRTRVWSAFLASRCSKAFLELHIGRAPGIIERVTSIGSYLSAAVDFTLLSTLRQHGFLSEKQLAKIFEQVRALAIGTPDADFIAVTSVREFFSETEYDALLAAVRDELVPNLYGTINDWESNRASDEKIEEYYEPLIDALNTFHECLTHHQQACDAIDIALKRIHSIIEEYAQPEPDEDDEGMYADHGGASANASDERHIYDDIDS